MWLDREIVKTFRAHQWSLPARVYGRPLELYPQAPVSIERLERELQALGYRRVEKVQGHGQYEMSSRALEFHARGFDFWDGAEQARRVRVTFGKSGIERLRDQTGAASIDVMRLEPPEIGRINPRRFEDRKLLQFRDLPPDFVRLLVAVEDKRFYEHVGVDPRGLARAMVRNAQAGRWVEGGSTLTQQLVKNFYLTRERSLRRKLVEMLMAIALDWRFEKNHILETYVNEVFLGQDGNRAIHGFELAAQFYFGRPLSELDLAGQALLVGMVKGPSAYNPRAHADAARARRNVVLDVLLAQNVIDTKQARSLKAAPLGLSASRTDSARGAPAFLGLVKRQLLREYSAEDLNNEGLSIHTTLDAELQNAAERAMSAAVAELESGGHSNLQAAMVIAEPASGEILGLIGDRNPSYAGFNRAVDAARPVGSTIKPFIYALALDEPARYNLATPLDDKAVRLDDEGGSVWAPENYDGREYGRVSMLEALTRSLNLSVVNLGLEFGFERVAEFMSQFGLGGREPMYPSMMLGAIALSPLKLTEMYTIFANDGYLVPLRSISAVTDKQGARLNRYGMDVRGLIEPATAGIMRFALSRVVERGTARWLGGILPEASPIAGKTGTTDDNRDSWFVGFGANRLAATWVGRDDNNSTGLTGSSGALRIWASVMQAVGLSPLQARERAGLKWRSVNLRLGVEVPEHCVNGERIPVHVSSPMPVSTTCDGHESPVNETGGGLFDRLRGLFGR